MEAFLGLKKPNQKLNLFNEVWVNFTVGSFSQQ